MESKVYFKVYQEAFTSGLVRDLGATRWAVLCAIASHMNKKGEAYPTQEKIAASVGMTRKTAMKHIASLLDYRWEGESVLTRELRKSTNNAFEYSCYRVTPTAQLAIFSSKVGEEDWPSDEQKLLTNNNHTIYKDNIVNKDNNDTGDTVAFTTAKDVITYYCAKYLETYGHNTSINWGRDVRLVKNKLMALYTSEQIKAIIDTVFAEYDRRWKSPKYQRPTIGALTTWLPNEALTLCEGVQIPEVPEHGGYDFEVIMARLKRRD